MRAAIALAKEDNRREEEDVFKPGYTGEPMRMEKKTKKVEVGGVQRWVSESEDSDLDEDTKERRRIEKMMVMDEAEKLDIGRAHMIS